MYDRIQLNGARANNGEITPFGGSRTPLGGRIGAGERNTEGEERTSDAPPLTVEAPSYDELKNRGALAEAQIMGFEATMKT